MHCKYMKTHFPLCYHHASVSAQCVCALSPRMWFAFVLRFSCWGKQLDGRIKSERESFTALSSSDLSQAHALITDTACQLDTRSISPHPRHPLPQANRESVYGFIGSVSTKDGRWICQFYALSVNRFDPCSSSPSCLIVSNSCAYVQKLTVWSGDWTLPPC